MAAVEIEALMWDSSKEWLKGPAHTQAPTVFGNKGAEVACCRPVEFDIGVTGIQPGLRGFEVTICRNGPAAVEAGF
jgi:hypothetical protein